MSRTHAVPALAFTLSTLAGLALSASVTPAPAAAQTYASPVRFGIGIDYGGLAGRGDGGAGGLRLQLGARVHEHVALYWQGQALAGAFVSPDETIAVGLGWNAAMVEASYGIFQVAAGPSFDASLRCAVDAGQTTAASALGCEAFAGPGIASRVGARLGAFALSGDLHVSFYEAGPDVWVLFGIGVQLGDEATEPMTFGVADRDAPSTDAPSEEADDGLDALGVRIQAPRAVATVESVALPRHAGRALDAPEALPTTPSTSAPTPEPAERAAPEAPERVIAPSTRRFSAGDVRSRITPARPRASEAAPEVETDALDFAGSDDPLEGLD